MSDVFITVRKTSLLKSAAILTGLGVVAAVSFPAFAGDAVTGKTLALRWCAACHLVAEDQPTASSASLPSFYDMAEDPAWTEINLATFLANPHPKMPDMALGNREISDLASYIGSLAP